ncbi:MAG TPA: RDD family protein [Opitutaceae bacterium]|nr:RDD family protein [Opitutaceae bacterium]
MNASAYHEIRLRTPEGVSFSFRLASPVLRLAALAIDTACIAAAWSTLSVLFSLLGIVSQDFARAAAIVGYFLFSEGCRIAMEWRWRGQTIGKRLLHLRVVDERGLPLTFAQVTLRNLLRFIDALPVAYAIGGVAALASSRGQRLGDLAAGTLVIWEPLEPMPDLAALCGEKYNSLRRHAAVVARLRQTISPAEARLAWQALARRDALAPEARVALFSELAAQFLTRTAIPDELRDGLSDEQFVRNVIDVLYFTRAEAAQAAAR